MLCTRLDMCNSDDLRVYVVSGVVSVKWDRVSMVGSLLCYDFVCV